MMVSMFINYFDSSPFCWCGIGINEEREGNNFFTKELGRRKHRCVWKPPNPRWGETTRVDGIHRRSAVPPPARARSPPISRVLASSARARLDFSRFPRARRHPTCSLKYSVSKQDYSWAMTVLLPVVYLIYFCLKWMLLVACLLSNLEVALVQIMILTVFWW